MTSVSIPPLPPQRDTLDLRLGRLWVGAALGLLRVDGQRDGAAPSYHRRVAMQALDDAVRKLQVSGSVDERARYTAWQFELLREYNAQELDAFLVCLWAAVSTWQDLPGDVFARCSRRVAPLVAKFEGEDNFEMLRAADALKDRMRAVAIGLWPQSDRRT